MNTKEKALQVAKEAYTLVPFYMELEEAEKQILQICNLKIFRSSQKK